MGFKQEDASDAPVGDGHNRSESGEPWYLVYTKPKQESVALQNLQQQGFHAYLPLYKRLKKAAASVQVGFEPMFARYVFFQPARSTQSISSATSTRGVTSLVRFGNEPALVKPGVLHVIQEFERRRNAADIAELSVLRPGKQVRLRNSALDGVEGLVKSVSSQRVAVLLELMGQPQLVNVEHHQLELV